MEDEEDGGTQIGREKRWRLVPSSGAAAWEKRTFITNDGKGEDETGSKQLQGKAKDGKGHEKLIFPMLFRAEW